MLAFECANSALNLDHKGPLIFTDVGDSQKSRHSMLQPGQVAVSASSGGANRSKQFRHRTELLDRFCSGI